VLASDECLFRLLKGVGVNGGVCGLALCCVSE